MTTVTNISEGLIAQYKKNANHTLALILRFAAVLMAVVALLAYLGIFKLANVIYPVMGASICVMLLPTLFYDILKISNNFLKYMFLTILVLMSGLLYSILSYHVIIMLVFPVIVSCLYCEIKSTVYTALLSYPVMAASHIIAFHLKYVPDEPLVTLHGVIYYGILPRFLEFTIILIIACNMTSKVQKLIYAIKNKNDEVYESQQNVITSLTEMIETQSQETGLHVKRVSEYTKILCRGLNMGEEKVWMVGTAAMMHDVGKIMVPTEIIEKPGKLTDEEF